jgi:hypothetical protein
VSLLSVDELKSLVQQAQGTCVSIYMPTVQLGSETQQNSIRFKNVMKLAEAKLQDYNPELQESDATAFLQPAHELDREEFWQHQDEGLALFIADGVLRYYCLPLSFDELVVVGDRSHLKPLLPLLTGDGKFYVLTLSQQQVRLFEGTRYSIHEVEVEDLPASMDEALQYDETAKDGQFRQGTSPGNTTNGPRRAGTFHGQGSPDRDDRKQDILQYFHQVDRALHNVLNNQKAPLVAVGVDYLLPIYREANTYQHLLDEGITESPKVVQPEELHTQAWAIVEPYYMQEQQAAVEHYQELAVTEKATSALEDVVPAAYYGRVEQLFVAIGEQQWGHFNPETNELQVHSDAEPGDEDLLNAAAIQTILNGGTVYAVEPDKVPDDALLAAVFRY